MDKNDFEINGDKLIKYCGRGVNCSDPLCVPDGIRVIGKDSFSGMNSLKTCIRIPVGVEVIEESAFFNCWDANFWLPNTIIKIGSNAFHTCNFSSINLFDGIQEIGDRVFSGCSKLGEIFLPDTVLRIETSIFSDCCELKKSGTVKKYKAYSRNMLFRMLYD